MTSGCRGTAYPIKVWFIILIVAAVLPPTLYAASVAFRLAKQEHEAQVDQLRTEAEAAAAAVAQKVDAAVLAGTALGASLALDGATLEGFLIAAQHFVSHQSLGDGVALVGPDDSVLVNSMLPVGTAPFPAIEAGSVEEVFATGKPHVSDLFFPSILNEWIVTVDVPTFRQGKVAYVVRIGIEPRKFLPPAALFPRANNSRAIVLDRKGSVISPSTDPKRAVSGRGPPELLAAIQQRRQGSVNATLADGRTGYITFRTIESLGWTVAICVPRDSFAAPLHRSLALIGIGGLVALFAGIGMAVMLSRLLEIRISRVADAALALTPHPDMTVAGTGVKELDVVLAAQATARGRIGSGEHELRRANETLHAAKEEAERANIAKAKFFAAASHDLRQPVQSLFLFRSALAEALADHPKAALVAHMGTALDGLKGLLDALLDVSRLDAGLVSAQIRNFPLETVLRPLAEEYRLRAAEKHIWLRWIPCSAVVTSDPVLLSRILRNFIENALRYTEWGGRILLGCHALADKVRVDVLDTGIGIPSDQLDTVFDEFYQVNNPSRDRAQGLGLGLAIVRRIGRLLDHPVTVRSHLGRGSCFSVTVPRGGDQAVYIPEKPPQEALRLPPSLVVVIDDEDLILLAMKAQLSQWGLEVVTAVDGKSAIAALAGRKPHLALIDYRLGGETTGLDAMAMLESSLGAPIRTCLLTGDTDPAILTEVDRCGATLLHKPIQPQQLWDAIR